MNYETRKIKLFYLAVLFLFFFLQAFFPIFAVSAPINCNITATLRLSSVGSEVQCLQNIIGAVPDGIFGPLTKAAVKAFQLRNGLTADGIVGPLSRMALNGVMTGGVAGTPPSALNNSSKKSESSIKNVNNAKNENPNLVNLDKFIETVVEVNRENGSSEAELQFMANALREAIISSKMDFNKEFEKLLIKDSKLSASLNTKSPFAIFDKIFVPSLSFVGIVPSVAQAAAGIPFGGALIFSFYCSDSANWMITIQPLPPSYAALLSYTPGTQKFASYNIPFTKYLLGAYTPPGKCVFQAGPYTVTITTRGTINPMVGSSPL